MNQKTKAAVHRCSIIKFCQNISQNLQKAPVLESDFNKIALLKARLRHQWFPAMFTKFLKHFYRTSLQASAENPPKNRPFNDFIISCFFYLFIFLCYYTPKNPKLIIKDPNESYKTSTAVLYIYNDFFPQGRIRPRHSKNSTLWISRGIGKSPKRKQKLYEKFLKNRTSENEMNSKNYRKLFESVKRKSKKQFLYSKQSSSKEKLKKRIEL